MWEDIYDTLNEHGNELNYSIFKELNKTCFINMINTKKAIWTVNFRIQWQDPDKIYCI